MLANEDHIQTPDGITPSVSPGNYSPSWQLQTLYLKDTIGAIFLGIFAVIFLVGWRLAESRNRLLKNQLRNTDGKQFD